MVLLYCLPNRRNQRYRTNDKQNIPTVVLPKHSIGIMVAGGITGFGKTELHIVEKGKKVVKRSREKCDIN